MESVYNGIPSQTEKKFIVLAKEKEKICLNENLSKTGFFPTIPFYQVLLYLFQTFQLLKPFICRFLSIINTEIRNFQSKNYAHVHEINQSPASTSLIEI